MTSVESDCLMRCSSLKLLPDKQCDGVSVNTQQNIISFEFIGAILDNLYSHKVMTWVFHITSN